DDEAGHGDHDDGVDEGLGHGDQALAHWVGGLRRGGCDCCGTHAGLVGEDASRETHLHHDDDGGADETAHRRGAGESVAEDHAECSRNLGGVLDKHDDAATQVDHDHHRHEAGGHRADGLDAAHQHSADT